MENSKSIQHYDVIDNLSLQADSVLTPEELRRIFQVSPGDSLPEYEVVTIQHRRHRRSAEGHPTHQVMSHVLTIYNSLEIVVRDSL